MESINAASLTPISVLSERRTESRKISSLPINPSLKTSKPYLQQCLSKTVQVGFNFTLLSSSLTAPIAKALTYEEALQQSTTPSTPDFDFINGLIGFGTENPLIIAGGITVLAIPLVLSRILKNPKSWGVESAKTVYAKLGDDSNAQLVDVRAAKEIKEMGSPDLKGLGKKVVSIVYRGEDKPGFLQKLSLRFKEPENTTLFILDKFDGNSELVAELVTVNGFKAAYAVKDGAEGPKGWMNSGLPWIAPRKSFSFDLSSLTESISEALGGSSEGVSLTLGLAAAAGLGLAAYTEIETILQILGSAAIVQFASKKLLFAEDRKKTVKEVDEFLTTKIAPKELFGELQEIGKALLPLPVTSNTLPAPAEATSEPTTSNGTIQKAETVTPEPTPVINSVPKIEPEPKAEPLPSRPLSPYASYPDWKPPASPTPSPP